MRLMISKVWLIFGCTDFWFKFFQSVLIDSPEIHSAKQLVVGEVQPQLVLHVVIY